MSALLRSNGPRRGARAAVLLSLLGLAASTTPAPLHAQQPEAPPPDVVFDPPLLPSEGFGHRVATDGTVIAALDAGHVALYARTGSWPSWQLQDAFALESTSAAAVDVEAELLAVGETSTPAHPGGVVHLYRRSGSDWVAAASLLPPLGAAGDAFGSAVSTDGATVVVGAPGHGLGGGVFVYTSSGSGWSLAAVLQASDAAAGDAFGSAVALSGPRLAVGAPQAAEGSLTHAGAAYVFAGSGGSWSEQLRVAEPGGHDEGRFASALALDGDTLLVGAPNADTDAAAGAGAGWVWREVSGTWVAEGRLASPYGATGDLAGYSVALQGDEALLGAPFASDLLFGTFWSGAYQRFLRGGGSWSFAGTGGSWTLIEGAHMGWSVALGADTTVGGAPEWGPGDGSLHVFAVGLSMPPWLDLGYALNGAAGAPSLQGSGPLTGGSAGALTLTQAAPGALSLLFVSLSPTPTPFKGGTLVPLPMQLERWLVTDGGGGWQLRWTAFPAGLPTWTAFYAQVGVVDAGATHGIALSNALAGVSQ